jgi:hypothetical protein
VSKKKPSHTATKFKKPKVSAADRLQKRLSAFDEAFKRVKARQTWTPEAISHIQPGIYFDIPFELYTLIPGVNYSTLKKMRTSPMHFRYRPEVEDVPSLRFGTLVHAGHLEPEKLAQLYVVLPEDEWLQQIPPDPKTGQPYSSPRSTKWWKETRRDFMRAHEGKQEVTMDEFNRLVGCIKALESHPRTVNFFKQGHPEVTIVWNDEATGIRCKARLDWIAPDLHTIVDIKTTADISDFRHTIGNYSYHLQGVHYRTGLNILTQEEWNHEIIALEKLPPFGIQSAPLSADAIIQGTLEYNFYLTRILECQRQKSWPGPESPTSWNLPSYYRRDDFVLNHPRTSLFDNV